MRIIDKSMTNFSLKLLCISLLMAVVLADSPPLLTISKLKEIRQTVDNVHYFVFLDHKLIQSLAEFPKQTQNVQYFVTDCKENIVKACESNKNSPLILLYNKVVIDYEMHNKAFYSGQNYDEYVESVRLWMEGSLNASPYIDPPFQKIHALLDENEQVFVMVKNLTVKEATAAYQILAKEYPFQKFVYLNQKPSNNEFNLGVGDFTLLLKNGTTVGVYDKRYPHRYDIWKMYVAEQLYPHFIGIKSELTNSRLKDHENRVIVFCDLSPECVRFWKAGDKQIEANKGEIQPVTKIIYRVETLKNIKLLELFFHVKIFGKFKLPFALVLNGQSREIKNLPERYVFEINPRKSLLGQIQEIIDNVDAGREKNYELSSGTPKKNGFYGKGSEKNIQKLSYQTYQSSIDSVLAQGNFYLLFITVFAFDCKQCEEFYSEYKKISSYLKAEEHRNIVLGSFDLCKDQIAYNFKGVPELILFKPNQEEPVVYKSRMDFEYVLKFIIENIVQEEKGNRENNDL